MPVIAIARKSLAPLHSYICEQQWPCSRLAISVPIIFTIILATILLSRQTGKRQLPKQPLRVSSAEQQHVTRTPKAPCSSIESNFLFVSDCWVQLKQGQGHFEKRANRAVSRRGASGTALVGLGGSREGGQMEEKERASAGSRSRGVSKYWSDGPRLSGGLPLSDQLPVPAAQSGHVGASRGEAAAGLHEEQDNMEDSRFGGFRTGTSSGTIQESCGLLSTSLLGGHMADDEHIFYGINAVPSSNISISGQGSPFPKPLTPPASAADSYPSLATHGGHQEGIAIPSRGATALRLIRGSRTEGYDSHDEAKHRQEDGASSSSYPPASPLLPPPPPTTHQPFDPSVVMFPGPARDGGIRVVPTHDQGELVPSSTQATSSSDHPGASWTRHTRVYGGGVCLACAAAAGDGGFYGESVRPEDRR